VHDDPLPPLATRLRATPAELAGLLVLLVGVVVAGSLWWTSGAPRTADATTASAPASAPAGGSLLDPTVPPSEVTVHVSGAVAAPGVVTLRAGARVADAVVAAGGLSLDADPGGVNLARPLVDGEQVVVPVLGEAPPPPGTAGAAGTGRGGVDADGRIDLNRATAPELEELPGVGPVLAGRIVAHREEHGPFREVGALRDVPGIGERTFQALVDHVTVG
jgi:competence protein ComEA